MKENKKITIISKQLTDKAAPILSRYKIKENVFFNIYGYDIGKMMEIIQPTEAYELEIVYEKSSQPDFVEIGEYKCCENISVKFIDERSLVDFTDGEAELVIKIFDTNHYIGTTVMEKIEKIIDDTFQEKHRIEFIEMNVDNIIELSKSLKDFRAKNTQQTLIPTFEVHYGRGIGTAMKRHNAIVEIIKGIHPINSFTIYSK